MYAVIDIGSNTIRLSIYKQIGADFQLMFNQKQMAGLAGYIDHEGYMSTSGLQKAVNTLNGFKQIITNIVVKQVFVFATASLRNIKNSAQALAFINRETGFDIDLVSGANEALYAFIGATHLHNLKQGMLIDIGGGSTELACYSDGKIEKAYSMPIGSLNLYKKHVHDILPTAKEREKINLHIKKELNKIELPQNYPLVCGVGGTVRAACKLHNALYHLPEANNAVEAAKIAMMLEHFYDDHKFATNKILKVVPDRIHTTLPGMAILAEIFAAYGSEQLLVSNYGVREGYLYTKIFREDNQHGNRSTKDFMHFKQGTILA